MVGGRSGSADRRSPGKVSGQWIVKGTRGLPDGVGRVVKRRYMAQRNLALVVLPTNNWNLSKANIQTIRRAVAEVEGSYQLLDFGSLCNRSGTPTP